MEIKVDNCFFSYDNDKFSKVYEIFPTIFYDSRGNFSEVMKANYGEDSIFRNLNWIRQINRSISKPGVIRGMHAQSYGYCQAKLVEVINGYVYDVIIDARPNSSTFGVGKFYLLDSTRQNKLFVPRGFLHGFIVPQQNCEKVIFNYFCDNVYKKKNEIGINPETVLPKLLENLDSISSSNLDVEILKESLNGNCVYSEKDKNGRNYTDFMEEVNNMYHRNSQRWYESELINPL